MRFSKELTEKSSTMGKAMSAIRRSAKRTLLVVQRSIDNHRIADTKTVASKRSSTAGVGRCIGDRLGRGLKDDENVRVLDRGIKRKFNQCEGTQDNPVCLEDSQTKVRRLSHRSIVEQHNSTTKNIKNTQSNMIYRHVRGGDNQTADQQSRKKLLEHDKPLLWSWFNQMKQRWPQTKMKIDAFATRHIAKLSNTGASIQIRRQMQWMPGSRSGQGRACTIPPVETYSSSGIEVEGGSSQRGDNGDTEITTQFWWPVLLERTQDPVLTIRVNHLRCLTIMAIICKYQTKEGNPVDQQNFLNNWKQLRLKKHTIHTGNTG
ncbi:hypothetical protein EC973_006225 [Apophysomyces ossiformis]|uniref:Uncharacterized protein n=1 Tax=Apophysomyces ossiformis TaxID=679940 RepID=A0A8H7BIN7_9FUNG|nr:hypothetical protein EC973_006225 [Apophysomyces ossiformis]